MPNCTAYDAANDTEDLPNPNFLLQVQSEEPFYPNNLFIFERTRQGLTGFGFELQIRIIEVPLYIIYYNANGKWIMYAGRIISHMAAHFWRGAVGELTGVWRRACSVVGGTGYAPNQAAIVEGRRTVMQDTKDERDLWRVKRRVSNMYCGGSEHTEKNVFLTTPCLFVWRSLGPFPFQCIHVIRFSNF